MQSYKRFSAEEKQKQAMEREVHYSSRDQSRERGDNLKEDSSPTIRVPDTKPHKPEAVSSITLNDIYALLEIMDQKIKDLRTSQLSQPNL